MQETDSPAVRELLAWVARRPRTYAETMDAWRSTCPRLTAWEDALLAGLVRVERGDRLDRCAVTLTVSGADLLDGAAPASLVAR